eukprot:1473048-Amphidinium_carterae.1
MNSNPEASLPPPRDAEAAGSEFPIDAQLQPRCVSASSITPITKDFSKERMTNSPPSAGMTSGASAAENVRKTVQTALAMPSWRTRADAAQPEEVMKEFGPPRPAV